MLLRIPLKNALLGLALSGIHLLALGQSKSYAYLNQANLLFRHHHYASAAQYYEKVIADSLAFKGLASPFAVRKQTTRTQGEWRSRSETLFHLAECYRHCHDYTKAETAFARAADSCSSPDPLAQYWYGVALRANGKYQQAMDALSRFEQHYNKMDAYLIGADLEIKNLRYIMTEQRHGATDSFVLRRQTFAGMNSAYAAWPLGQDSISFTGIPGGDSITNATNRPYTNRLYRAFTVDGNAVASRPLHLTTPPERHDGMACFSNDGSRMYFTRWSDSSGSRMAAIYETHHTDTGWTNPKKVEGVNLDGYSSAQPSIVESPDGYYLLFSSNRPGGVGSFDLWTAWLDSAWHVLRVGNMGNTINTTGDEMAPYFHKNSRNLIFSTNGRPGAGGFDIWYAPGNIGLSRWERPANAGLAINSPRDDLYFSSSDSVNCWNTGWLSSDRQSDCCLALYSFRQLNEQVVMGTVVDCQTGLPLKDARLLLEPGGGKTAISSTTGPDGRYRFDLHNTSFVRISATASGYSDTAVRRTLTFKSATDTFMLEDICLTKPTINPGAGIDTATHQLGGFRFGDYKLAQSCVSRLDSIAAAMSANTALVLELDGYTDGRGSKEYNLVLAARRVEACILYLTKKGIQKDRLTGKAMGKCCPLFAETINGKDNPAARKHNRRVEYKFSTRE